jgi:enoyl-CoA hydratase
MSASKPPDRGAVRAVRQSSAPAVPYATLLYDVAPTGVATIALNSPDTRNALSDDVLDDLLAAFAAARDDEAVRCVVLASTHETTFSAGGNLAAFASDDPPIQKHLRSTPKFPALFTLIGSLGKPVICAVNGHCLAGAMGLALACDLVVASERATFGTPEINVGVFPFMVTALLSRNLPRKKAAELLLLGERIDAAEAERLGIVNRVATAEEFEGAVREWAERLAAKSPVLMRLGKDAMFRVQDMALADALDYMRAQLTLAFSTEDIKEGVQAFFEKREPVWKGR